ncbi:MAG: S8 family peptidase [Flavobacteriales bacterium]|nr:S8 family peptidase [Flavobacteriales bacterium]
MKRFVLLILILFSSSIVYAQKKNRLDASSRKRIENARIIQQNTIERMARKGYARIIQTEDGEYSELVGEGSEGQPRYYVTSNVGTGKTIGADKLNGNVGTTNNLSISKYGGSALTGQGITIGMWDSGSPRLTHTLLAGQVELAEGQSPLILRHPTHITGTMVGTTSCSNPTTFLNCRNAQKARGIAYNSTVSAFDWRTDVLEMQAQASINGEEGLLIANNSYGYNPVYLKEFEFGKYGKMASDWDAIMCGAPYFQIVKSAGNIRDDNSGIVPQAQKDGGYDLLEGAGVAKNVLVVGAINAKTELDKITLNTKIQSENTQEVTYINRYEFISEDKCPTEEEFQIAWEKIYGVENTPTFSKEGSSIIFDEIEYTIKGDSNGFLGFASILKKIETTAVDIEPKAFYGNSLLESLIFTHLTNIKPSSGDTEEEYEYEPAFDENSRLKELKIKAESQVSIPDSWLLELKNIKLLDFSRVVELGSDIFPLDNSFTLLLPNAFIEGNNLSNIDLSENRVTVLPSDSKENYWNYSFYNESSLTTDFSSWGGTDDGRIKPELVAQGVDVFSSIESTDDSYALYNGTSSAAASVSAGIALLQEYYEKFSGNYMRSSTVRALLVHSVDEIGKKGPDYRHGYGIVNVEKAADIIYDSKRSSMILESSVPFQDSVQIMVALKGEKIINEEKIREDFIATLAWTDPAKIIESGKDYDNLDTDDSLKTLVNDLDIRVERLDKNGESISTYYPWKLQGIQSREDTELLATREGKNTVDNLEKVEIENYKIPNYGGMYRIIITNKNNQLENNCYEGGQPFSLVLSGISYCESDIILVQPEDNIDISNVVVKAGTITASNIISSNVEGVEYLADKWIALQTQGDLNDNLGFYAGDGTDFLAEIVPCGDEIENRDNSQFIDTFAEIIKNDTEPQPGALIANPKRETVVVYPNPVVSSYVNVQFDIVESSTVFVDIYDMQGRLIIVDEKGGEYPKGEHKKVVDVGYLQPGAYMLIVKTKNMNRAFKILKK